MIRISPLTPAYRQAGVPSPPQERGDIWEMVPE
jgi:hypothetical protein